MFLVTVISTNTNDSFLKGQVDFMNTTILPGLRWLSTDSWAVQVGCILAGSLQGRYPSGVRTARSYLISTTRMDLSARKFLELDARNPAQRLDKLFAAPHLIRSKRQRRPCSVSLKTLTGSCMGYLTYSSMTRTELCCKGGWKCSFVYLESNVAMYLAKN